MMRKSDEIYNELKKSLTDEEIVENYVFNDHSGDDYGADKEFREIRLRRLRSMSNAERLFGKLMQLKYRIVSYIESSEFHENYSFSNQLKEYSKIIDRSNKQFAADLSIHHTKISKLINGKENPNIELMYRLEEHSNGEIPAHHWWRLYAKELEYKILTDLDKRVEESKKVSNSIIELI